MNNDELTYEEKEKLIQEALESEEGKKALGAPMDGPPTHKELTNKEKEALIVKALESEEGRMALAMTMRDYIRTAMAVRQSLPLEARIFMSEEEKQRLIKEALEMNPNRVIIFD